MQSRAIYLYFASNRQHRETNDIFSATECVLVVQGHPRSIITSKVIKERQTVKCDIKLTIVKN